MISRIYVIPRTQDGRSKHLRASWNTLASKGKVSNISLVDSYTIDAELTKEELAQIAQMLTNPVLEHATIDQMPLASGVSFVVEIGFLPGVTDNVGHTAMEAVADLLHRNWKDGEAIYSSKTFLVSGTITESDVKTIALSLHNPLIEHAYIAKASDVIKAGGLPKTVPQVVLTPHTPVISVSLNVGDEELIAIGKQGVKDQDGSRRGPLALDLISMKTIQVFFKTLKRDPTDIELESLAQTWSEHCKHTIFANPIDDISNGLYKTYIKGATNLIRKQMGKKDFCVSVFSDNAGGIVFDKDHIVTHKVETHNSPSALDPFGGAITGIVGVNRDTIGFGLGAKPVANLYGYCFGNPFDTRPLYRDKALTQKMLSPRRIMDGVVKGVNVGGNCSGIPTVSGFVRFDDGFRGKPLVFVGTVGLSPRLVNGKPAHEKEAKAGDYIVVVGGKVGADGIHGATFSSVTMDSSSPATAVQIGDPITQKKLSDAIVKEARDLGLYSSITDNGAGGISCSIAEMAKECGGALVQLEKVPLKYPGLSPWQIWISESQERMTLSVPKEKWEAFNTLMQSRGVLAVVVGEFTNSGNCVVNYHGKEIMNLPLSFLHDGLPKRPLHTQQVSVVHAEPVLPKKINKTLSLLALLANGNMGSFEWISEQYDHEVQASSVLKPLTGRGSINTDAQVIRPVLTSHKGVVLSTGLYPSYSAINTYHMAASSIDTAIRNAVACGGTLKHLAILDNFCWCSSYDEKRLAQLVDALRACYDYAVGYGTPFISGKDSMFNDFKGYDEKGNPVAISIPPTLLVSAIGVIPDIRKVVSPEFKTPGDVVYVIGETHDELGGSEYAKFLAQGTDAIGNNVPQVNWQKNKKAYSALEKAIEKELISSSLSITSGGLAVALVKASIGGKLGHSVFLKNLVGTATTTDAQLFSESQGRILVSVNKKDIRAFEKVMQGIPLSCIGTVEKKEQCKVYDNTGAVVVDATVSKLDKAYRTLSKRVS